MTASSGPSADRRWAVGAIGFVVAVFLLASCSASSNTGGSQTPKARPDEQLRDTIKTALTQAGRTAEADIVKRDGSRLTPMRASFLETWRIIRVDYRQGAHPVMFHVGVGGSQAYLLTGIPKAFNQMTAADGGQVTDDSGAAEIARLYVETTRPAGELTYVVGGVDEIKFRPGLTGADAQYRDEIARRFRSVVTAPTATAKGTGFTVTAYVVEDKELQRRTLDVTSTGSATEKVAVLVDDLPTPIVL